MHAIAWLMFSQSQAQAQAQSTNFPLTSKTGCKLFHKSFSSHTGMKLIHVASSSQCVDGFYQGAIVYSVSWTVHTAGKPSRDEAGVQVGTMQRGMLEGTRLNFYPNSSVWLLDQNNFAIRGFTKQGQTYSLQNEIAAISKDAGLAVGQSSAVAKEHLIAMLKIWDQDPAAFMNEYLGGTTMAGATSSSPQQTAPPVTLQDDPKVFGRSARGG